MTSTSLHYVALVETGARTTTQHLDLVQKALFMRQ